MTRAKLRRVRTLMAAASILAIAAPALAPTLAFAQDDAETDVGEVVVTASRIRGAGAVGSNVVSIGQEDMREAGVATTADILRKVPQIIGLGPSATAASAQNGAANVTRGSGINLRGIGVNSTLLLLDGRRLPPAGTQGQFTDPSVVPSIALQRIEVVADGASAIYGSDAITGVVNLIPRKDFGGLEVRGRYGSADGYDEGQGALIAGKQWENGGAMIAYERIQNSVLTGNEREFYTSDLRAQGGQDLRSTFCAPGTIVVGTTNYPIPATGVTAATAGALVAGAANRCDLIKANSIIPEMKRDNALAYIHQSTADGSVEFFGQYYYGHRDFTLYGNGATPGFAQAVTIRNTNPYFASPQAGATTVAVNFNFIPEAGVDYNRGYGESRQWVVGSNFKLAGDWRAEAVISRGDSHDEVNRMNAVNAAALAIAAADPNPATALNPFGSGPNNPATLAAIRSGQTRIIGDNFLNTYELHADGGIIDLPGGRLRSAVGVEKREEGISTDLIGGTPAVPTLVHSKVERKVTSYFAELYIPVIGADNATGPIKSFDISLAERYERYSDFGATSNPKVGATWGLAGGVKLRGTWGTSFRAPSPIEYDTIGGGAGLYGDTIAGPGGNQFGIGIAGGNANLEPEKATTWSVGAEYKPTFLPGASVSLNYFDIDYENQILALRGTTGLLTLPIYAQFVKFNPTPAEVNALLNSGLFINTPITAANVTFIADGRRQNLGQTKARGYDFHVGYTFTTPVGDFALSTDGTYFTRFQTAVAKGAALNNTLGLINNPQRLRAQTAASYYQGPVSGRIAWNHTSSYTNNTVTPGQKVSAYNTYDVHIGLDLETLHPLLAKTSLSVDVINASDERPPFVNIATGYDPQSAGPIGRMVAVSIGKAF